MPATFKVIEDTRQQKFVRRLLLADLQVRTSGTRVWEVFASEPVSAAAAIAAMEAAEADSKIGAAFDSGVSCFCVDQSSEVGDDTQRTKWVITCSYSNELPTFGGSGSLVRSISYSSVSQEESYFKDRSETPKYARNTAGVRFRELPKRQRSHRVISVSVEVPYTATMATYDGLDDCVNSDPVEIEGVTYAARTLLLSDLALSAAVMTGESAGYKTLSFKLTRNRDTWAQKFESVGLDELVSGALKPIWSGGVRVEEPYPLQATGEKAGSSNADGAVITLEPYAAVPMAALVTSV